MQKNPNKLTSFWLELKRRKVFGVVTTYAATAYIIIEVVNNLIGPFRLPEWIPTLAALLLVAGLPVVIVLSWIFDFTPRGIKKTESLEELEKEETMAKPVRRGLRPSYVLNAILIIAVIILAYPKIFKPDTLKKIRSSGERIAVAVMPFQNMTNDTIWNVWQDGIQNEIINNLTNSEELIVKQYGSVTNILENKGLTNYAAITPALASTISQKLDADIFIMGSIKQAGDRVRMNAQIIDSKTKENLKSFQIEEAYKEDKIFQIVDTLSSMVRNFLIISDIDRKNPDMMINSQLGVNYNKSAEAYRYYIYGLKAFSKSDMPGAIRWYSQSIAIDSNFFLPLSDITWAYLNLGLYDKAKQRCIKLCSKKDLMSMAEKNHADLTYSYLFETINERIRYLKQFVEVDEEYYFLLGNNYMQLSQYDQAVVSYEKSFEYLTRAGGSHWLMEYTFLGNAYHKAGQFKKEKKLYKKAAKEFPDTPSIIRKQASLSLIEGDTVTANKYIKKYISMLKSKSVSELSTMGGLAALYSDAGVLGKAEDYYLKGLSLQPDSAWNYNTVAWFMIDNNYDVDKGLKLIDKALEMMPDQYEFLDTKGWGLYKQGKYKEALDLLQKSWDLRLQKAIYTYEPFLHLEAAKKAVAGMK
jgi:TolB-like protein/Tfp pilus assembly protein PilF